MAGEHDHKCDASAELCQVVQEIDDGQQGDIIGFALVLIRADSKVRVLASSSTPDLDSLRALLACGAQAVLAQMPPPTDTRN